MGLVATDIRESQSVRQAPLMEDSLPNLSRRPPPKIFSALKQKRSILCSEKARIWGEGIGEGEGGKINPPSLLHYSFLSPTSPICVYFASFCETDPKKNYFSCNQVQIVQQPLQIGKASCIKDFSLP